MLHGICVALYVYIKVRAGKRRKACLDVLYFSFPLPLRGIVRFNRDTGLIEDLRRPSANFRARPARADEDALTREA